MGIRFACPNGHRLNVKSYLAGKRGICPHCGVRFDIPLTSWPGYEKRGKKGEGKGSDIASEFQVANPAPPLESAHPALPSRTHLAAPTTEPMPSSTHPSSTSPSVPHEAPPSAPIVDPFTAPHPSPQPTEPNIESPSGGAKASTTGADWFVQTDVGNRYGPADDETMRSWIAEGRVAPENLVHRRGWSTWKTAANVFAELKDGKASESGDEPGLIVEKSPRVCRSRGRQKAKPRLIALVATLGIASAVLLGALIYVINRT